MANTFLTINSTRIAARNGETVLAAAEAAGLRLPKDDPALCQHDTPCESCRIRLDHGAVEGGEPIGHTVLACRARVSGEATLSTDPVPREMKSAAEVVAWRTLSAEIVELVLRVEKPVPYLPGQHVTLAFGKSAPRRFTPTLSLDGLRELDTLHFHIRRREGGLFGTKPEERFRPGARVKLAGPYGNSHLRQGDGRLVLVSSGTGFSAIWSIAVAARLGQPHRPVHLIASAHDPRDLYMRPALEWLARQGVENVTLTASGAHPLPPVRHGRATAHLPALMPSDTVHVAGHPGLVRAVMLAAAKAGATAYGVPHAPAQEEEGVVERIARYLSGSKKAPAPVPAPQPLPANVRQIRPV
ncbi:MAG: 2Fe-2S iron-sulfur cluster binding domain-containing protein [Beijerinckiaceae bacterium]|jgi:3-phenylpropionate/trans-cinnamate dioxygenase ferredoxin reductase subunit|nr:2Fe-2S iron-sulfur cluster binding domain-containing protein [Beijerinckiaceae bacterium]